RGAAPPCRRVLRLGDPDRRERAAAVQPDELPQRVGVAARQLADRGGAATVRARRGGTAGTDGARGGRAPLRGPASPRALLRLRTTAWRGTGPVSRRMPAARGGRGQPSPPARGGARARNGRRPATDRLPPAAAPELALVAGDPESPRRGRTRRRARAPREVRRLDRDRAEGRRRRDRRDAVNRRV